MLLLRCVACSRRQRALLPCLCRLLHSPLLAHSWHAVYLHPKIAIFFPMLQLPMFRTATWLAYGARWFTASGYERSAQGFDPRDNQAS
jgi:hypothetical protein